MAPSDMPGSNLTRRTFLKSATAATIGGIMAGRTASALSAEKDEQVVIGEGNYRYAVDHEWAKLPPGKAFGYTHGVVEDRQGRIYIANQSKDAIMVFDQEGTFVNSWGEEYAAGAHGLEIAEEDGEEILYLANTGLAEVVKTTLTGKVIWKAKTPDILAIYDADKGFSPTETAVGPDGNVYVADGYGQSWIHVYSSGGKHLHAFGGQGGQTDNLNGPHGISIDRRSGTPYVQVSDRNNVRVINFDLDGNFVEEVIPRSELRFPCTTFHADNLVYIPDLFARVSIFDESNNKVADLGDYVGGRPVTAWGQLGGPEFPELAGYPNIPHEKRLPGKFSSPHALWVDSGGNIFVVEWIEDGRVTKMTKV